MGQEMRWEKDEDQTVGYVRYIRRRVGNDWLSSIEVFEKL